jgi:glycosyltransferase involved in cell wall biosynthesis
MKLARRLSLLRYRARSIAERVAEAPRSGAEAPRLSVAVVAQDCVAELTALVENVRDVACEVVVVDGGSRDASLEYCRSDPLVKLIERPWDGHFGRQKNTALAACSGDWILHLDTDERIGPGLKARLSGLCASSTDFYRVPMYWLASEQPARYVDTIKHYPCWVPRLLRNLPEFRYEDAHPVHVRFPKTVTRRMRKIHGAHIFHYCFAWLSRDQLEAKASRYEREHPGSEATTDSYYRYWRSPHDIRPCVEPPPEGPQR